MYTVRWQNSALEELVKIWVGATTHIQRQVTRASQQIDERLKRDPYGEGESRSAGRRILLETPLGVTYRIESDRKTVSVLNVWLFRS